MDLKFESHEVGQDGRGTRLRFDWGGFLAGFGTDDGKAVGREMKGSVTDPCGARSVDEGNQCVWDGKAGMLSVSEDLDVRDNVRTCRG